MTSIELSCRVCCDRSDGSHFGVEACRACAAFFRRSVSMKKKYRCRQGSNSCYISKSIRCICRRCRFEKCLRVGMLPESVQNPRDYIIPRIPHKTEAQHSSHHLDESPSISENELSRLNSHSGFQLGGNSQSVLEEPIMNVYNQPTSSHVEMPHILMKITDNYRRLCAVRRRTELSINGSSLRNMFDESTEGLASELSAGSMQRTCTVLRAHIPAIADFVSTSFEEFSLLNQEEKVLKICWDPPLCIVFRAFLTLMVGMDTFYRTYRLVPPELYPTMNVVTETMFLDFNDLMQFFADTPSDKVSIEDLERMLEKCFNDRNRMDILKQIKALEISEHEYSALIALALWTTHIKGATDTIVKVAAEARAKIFHDLHLLYRRNGRENYAVRFGELVTLHTTFQVDRRRFFGEVELFNIFDVFEKDFLLDMCRDAPC